MSFRGMNRGMDGSSDSTDITQDPSINNDGVNSSDDIASARNFHQRNIGRDNSAFPHLPPCDLGTTNAAQSNNDASKPVADSATQPTKPPMVEHTAMPTREENQRRTAEADALVHAMAHPEMSQAAAVQEGYAQYNARHKTNIKPEVVADQTKGTDTNTSAHTRTEPRAEHNKETHEPKGDSTKDAKHEKTQQGHFATPDNRTWDVVTRDGKLNQVVLTIPGDAKHSETFGRPTEAQLKNFQDHHLKFPDDAVINKDGTSIVRVGKNNELSQTFIDNEGKWASNVTRYPDGSQTTTSKVGDSTVLVLQDLDAKKQLSEMPSLIQVQKNGQGALVFHPTSDDRHLYRGPGDKPGTLDFIIPVFDKDHNLIELKHQEEEKKRKGRRGPAAQVN